MKWAGGSDGLTGWFHASPLEIGYKNENWAIYVP